MIPSIALQQAIVSYRLRNCRDSGRMREIQSWCCTELQARGLTGAACEVRLTGAYRDKNWDVALVSPSGEVLLAISTKTLVSNHGGSVPNRIDDMIGEAANLHRKHPRAVIGYLAFMHHEDDGTGRVKDRARSRIWFDKWAAGVSLASGRASEHDAVEQWEVASVNLIDLDNPNMYLASSPWGPGHFFDLLVVRVQERFQITK